MNLTVTKDHLQYLPSEVKPPKMAQFSLLNGIPKPVYQVTLNGDQYQTYLRNAYSASPEKAKRFQQTVQAVREEGRQFLLACFGIGTGLGALLGKLVKQPGVGCFVGMFGGTVLGSQVIRSKVEPWLEKLTQAWDDMVTPAQA